MNNPNIYLNSYLGLILQDEYYENEIVLSKFARYLEIKELRTQVDPKSWQEFQYITVVNAFYHSQINTAIVTAGILQGVFKRSKDGNNAGKNANQVGLLTEPVSKMGEQFLKLYI